MVGWSAALVALSFWFEVAGVLVLVAFVPLFAVLLQEDSVIRIAKYSFVFSIALHLLLMSWLTTLYPMTFLGFDHVSGLVVFIGWLLFSLWLSIPMTLCFIGNDGFALHGLRKSLVMASLWVIMEWILELGDMGFPWFRISLPLANVSILAQAASLIGSLGLSFVVIFTNMSIASYMVLKRSNPKVGRSMLLWGILILLLSTAYGIDRTQGLDKVNQESINLLSWHGDDDINVAILQGNIASSDKWEEGSEWFHFQTYREMSLQAIGNGAKLVVWPETALPVALNDYEEMMDELKTLSQEFDVSIAVGSFYEVNEEAEMNVSTNAVSALIHPYQDGLYNGIYFFPKTQLYTKQHLVPIGEYMPRWMTNVLPLLRNFQLANQLSKAPKATLLMDQNMKIGSLICFESIFPSLARAHVQNGANLLLIASNDAWYSGSAEISQHKNHAIFRAIESNRYVIRAANTGISAVIDPTGNVVASLGDNRKGIVYSRVRVVDKISWYHEFPHTIVLFSWAVLLVNVSKFNRKRLLSFMRYMKYSRVR